MKLSKYYRCVYITKDQSGGFALYMLCSHFPQFVSSSSHTKRFTFRLRRKLAIRESEMIKWTWKNVDAEEINFGPYTDESNEGATTEEEATTEEGANNRKAMGEPQWKWKCRTPWSMKRKASDPPGLLDLEERTGHCAITISQPTKFCAKKQQKKAHNSLSMYC